MNKLAKFFNYLSACTCFLCIVLLSIELGFSSSTQNQYIFAWFYQVFSIYFLLDFGFRLIFQKFKRKRLWTRVPDILLIFPLVGEAAPALSVLSHHMVVQLILLIVIISRLTHIYDLFELLRFNPAQIFILVFLFLIFLGALLLSLPISNQLQTPLSFVDALFTATSAVCVTGLTIQNTGTFFSGFGQGIILFLIQLGGLGIMTFYAIITLVLSGRLSQKESKTYQDTLATESVSETFKIIKSIIKFTLIFEGIGALILIFFWWGNGDTILHTIYLALFHAISAFCNAGFTLFSDSLSPFASDWGTLLTISALIVTGGLGFPAIFNLIHQESGIKKRLKLQTKLSLWVTGILLVGGTLIILFGEFNHALSAYSTGNKILLSLFHAVSSRTAGFHAISLPGFQTATLWAMMFLMFVGASPGSTGGGIKTTTFGVLMASFWQTIKGQSRVELFGRTITTQTIFKALSIMVISISIISTLIYILMLIEPLPFLETLFEVISAFGTVGYSVGITSQLSNPGKLLFIVLMLIGRIGPLTMAFALTKQKEKPNYSYPEEKMLLG